MRKQTINCLTGKVEYIELTEEEVSTHIKNKQANEVVDRVRQRKKDIAKKRKAAVEALLEEQLMARAEDPDAPTVFSVYKESLR